MPEHVRSGHTRHSALTSVSTWFVPGRLEVFGKHTDYAGGRSLVCAVPRGITISAETTAEGRVLIHDLRTGEQAEFSSRGDGSSEGWRRYPFAVIRRLAVNFPRARLSARLTFSSDLPQAAGISSSSALVVAIAEALVECASIDHSMEWREAIRTPEDRAGYFGCIENGADYGPLEGSAGVGTHGGSEDHAAIVMSRAGELREFTYSPLRLVRGVRMPGGWTFVLATSGVAAEKGSAVREQYNHLAQATTAIVEAWRARNPRDVRPLGQLVREENLHRLALSPDLRSRLQHFIAEDARVALAANALMRGDIATIGELAAASQADADRLLGNQIPETMDLVARANSLGAAAASAFGAGWGGSVWAMVPAADASAFRAEWLAAYHRRYPHVNSEAFVSPPSDGLRRLPHDSSPIPQSPF